MTDSTSTSAFDAVESDGFVDYYRLLNLPADADAGAVQERIATLHNEAQANRDHRNMAKRQQYHLLLELLPQARTILLNEDKRAQYDEYLEKHRAGETAGDHEEFLKQLATADDTVATDATAILGVQKEQPAAQPPLRETVATPERAARPAQRPVAPESAPAFSQMGASVRGSFISALVFFVFFVVFHVFIFHQEQLVTSVLVAALAGLISWWLTHYRLRNKTSV